MFFLCAVYHTVAAMNSLLIWMAPASATSVGKLLLAWYYFLIPHFPAFNGFHLPFFFLLACHKKQGVNMTFFCCLLFGNNTKMKDFVKSINLFSKLSWVSKVSGNRPNLNNYVIFN